MSNRQAKQTLDAIYEHGVFRVLEPEAVQVAEGQRVRLLVNPHNESEPTDSLELLGHMYDGLPDEKIDEIERLIHDRSSFFGDRPQP